MDTTGDERSNPYALGHATGEIERLIEQARFFGDLTERLFCDAGMGPAMRVLDVGCGVGDVSFLARSLVGPDGAVTGVDRSPEAIAVAVSRAADAGLANVRFIVSDIDRQIADVTRALLPLITRTGVASGEIVDIDTLETRLRDEAVTLDATLVAPPLIGAWGTNRETAVGEGSIAD